MRFLAIDLGDKRTGLAVGDAVTLIASPVDVLEVPISANAGEDLVRAVVAAAKEHVGLSRAELVVGLPLNMDGSEGPRAKQVRAFAARLGTATGMRVNFQDERLTSVEADWNMARSGMTHKDKKGKRDALAAAVLLRDYLAGLATGGSDTGVDGAG
ncbi:MAG: Holliday junction resolvase RuvX [Phycisphaerales bacterium]